MTFDLTEESGADRAKPLAARMRPRSLTEFVGQEQIVGEGKALRRAIEADRLPSLILWGPPGSGKTTLAEVIAAATQAQFMPISAVSSGVADLRRIVEAAGKLRLFNGRRTILFIDEIHRFNKSQQDAVLPFVEDGTVTLIGATTENPGFEVNPALRSRCRVFRLEKLGVDAVTDIVHNALSDAERGLGHRRVKLDDGVLELLVSMSDGDARIALTALEMAVDACAGSASEPVRVTRETVEEVMQQPALLYDKAGDMHYHLISAFIKSLRGSDPDAAVYWLARMLESGEDPMFVARRLVILASEDVGLADSQAVVIAVACQTATHSMGMPEAYLPLTEATLYLATAPKSNSVIATYGRAISDVRETLSQPVPLHLRSTGSSFNRSIGYGRDYQYSHDYVGHWVQQQYLPDALAGKRYYLPTEQGAERAIAERMAALPREEN